MNVIEIVKDKLSTDCRTMAQAQQAFKAAARDQRDKVCSAIMENMQDMNWAELEDCRWFMNTRLDHLSTAQVERRAQ